MGVVRAGNFKTVGQSNAQIVGGSLRFDDSKSQYLTRTPSSAGNRRTWTWSAWVKRTATDQFNYLFDAVTTDPSTGENRISFQDDEIKWYSNATTDTVETSALFRDYSGWYHLTVAYDSTASTDSNRIKIYINGVQQSLTGTYPSSNVEPHINNTRVHRIASSAAYGREFGGLMAQVYLIDGQQLDASYFGYTDPLTNTWRPKNFDVKKSTLNNGTVWSNTLTKSSEHASNTPVSLGFDGITGTGNNNFVLTGGGGTIEWTASSYSFPPNSTVEVWKSNTGGANYRYWNVDTGSGYGSNITEDGNSGWLSLGTLSNIQKIRCVGTNVDGYGAAWGAIRINGITLVDSNGFGANGFYLPLDGNTPIGQDRSGKGNNWTPVNFGGSNTIEKATGALPILNTDGGGKVARVGVRTDSNSSSLVLALPLVGIKSDFSNAINSGTSNKAITANGNAAASSAQSNFYGGSFYFDGTGDYLDMPDSADYTFGTGNFTCEMWIYPTSSGATDRFLGQINSGGNTANMSFRLGRNSGTFICGVAEGSTDYTITGQDIPANKWTHLALVRDGNTLRAFQDGIQTGTTSFSGTVNDSSNKLAIGRLGENDGNYFTGYISDVRIYKGVAKYTQNFIPASTDPDILPDTPSGVAYSSNVALVPSTDGAVAFDNDGDYLSLASSSDFALGTNDWTIEWFAYPTSNAQYQRPFYLQGSNVNTIDGVYTDGTGIAFGRTNVWASSTATNPLNRWNHYALVHDSTNMRLYINGVQVLTDSNNFGTDASKSLNIAYSNSTFGGYFAGQISNFHIVKDQALYTSNFTPPTAPITSVANTKLLCCKSNSSATAADVTPGTITANGNAAATNFNPFTVNINTVRGKQSGYATLNPLASNSSATVSNGNLNYTHSGAGAWQTSHASVGIETGKIYFEVNVTSTTSNNAMVGVSDGRTLTNYSGVVYAWGDGNTLITDEGGGNAVSQGTVATSTVGDTIGVAVNKDNSQITFYKNGISLISISSVPTWAKFPSVTAYSGGGMSVNFGQKPFKFPPPAGFQPLALANTPRPTIVRPDQYVGVTTYTGLGNSGMKVSGYNFKPDLIWIKARNQVYSNILYDSVRGTGSTKAIFSDDTAAEGSYSQYVNLASFDRDGFTVGSTGANNNAMSSSAANFVAWCWRAGGSGGGNSFWKDDIGYSTASAAGLTAGSITPTGASVNTKSGFSIVTYNSGSTTGNFTVDHGLNAVPKFIIHKMRSTGNWWVYHASVIDDLAKYLQLNSTNAIATNSANMWGGAFPTSSVFGVRVGDLISTSQDAVTYLWAEIPGFSKFGRYTGNGSSNGPMIVTGFKPSIVLVKNSSGVNNWLIFDNKRDGFNVNNDQLYPNSNAAVEDDGATYNFIDLLSDGFKFRNTATDKNGSGGTYIYAAFAESPSFNLYGGQSNAR